jgi:hypothetical protein
MGSGLEAQPSTSLEADSVIGHFKSTSNHVLVIDEPPGGIK